MLLSRSSFQVPPVERISTPRALSSRAKSTTPVLSETLISARRTGRRVVWSVIAIPSGLIKGLQQAVLLELLAQGATVETENLRGPGLVAPDIIHDALQQRRLDLGQYH